MQDLIITVNNNEYTVKFLNSNPNLLINGKKYQIEVLKEIEKNIYSFKINDRIYQAEIHYNKYDKTKIFLNGIVYDVDISTSTRKLIEKFIKQSSNLQASGTYLLKAPMPGLIIKILVEEGQKIQKGDKLVIIEAMKMENSLQSNFEGVVKSIKVSENNPVDKDQVLVEIDVK